MADHTPHPEHPSPQELAAYRSGALGPERMDEVRHHLAECRGECVDWVLDLAEFESAAPPTPEGDWEAQQREDWRRLEARLQPASRWPGRWPLAAAAMLLLSLALGAVLAHSQLENRRLAASLEEQQTERARALGELRAEAEEARREVASANRRLSDAEQQIAGLAASLAGSQAPTARPRDLQPRLPQLFIPSADLFPENFVRSAPGDAPAGEATRLTVPPGIDLFTVTLNLADPGQNSAYRLRILDRTGREVWSGEGLQLTRFGNFSVVLSRRTFPAARYRFEVDGQDAAGWQTLESYELEITD
ncbi:MAG: hypothetical protein AAF481_11150 [Acidobacteriota bacterium]